MSELIASCPFCGSAGVLEPDGIDGFYGDGDAEQAVECLSCDAWAPSIEAWNTRAAPTMRAWEWAAMLPHDNYKVRYTCNGFEIRNDKAYGWSAHFGTLWLSNKDGEDEHATQAEAQAACVAYVESKLKEWLV